MPARKLDQDHLRRLHAEGLSTEQMAERLGVSTRTVNSNRKALGLPAAPRRRSGGRPALVDRDAIARLHKAGLTGPQIAERLNCSENTIWRIRKELGLNGGRQPLPAERINRVQAMLNDGWPWAEITRTEGIHHDTLERYFPGTQWTAEQMKQHRTNLRRIRKQATRSPYANPKAA